MSPLDCPICRSAVSDGNPYLPFCSQRCRKIDFARWFDERYGIPVSRRQALIDEESGLIDEYFSGPDEIEAGMENAPPG